MAARRYRISLLVFNSISRLFSALTFELLSWTLEEKFHIYMHLRIILHLFFMKKIIINSYYDVTYCKYKQILKTIKKFEKSKTSKFYNLYGYIIPKKIYWHNFLKNVHHPYLDFFLRRADDSSQLGWNLRNECQHLCGNLLKKISVSYLKVCECNDELMCGVSWPEILVA